MSGELLRYHRVLDALAVQPEQAERLRRAAAAVQAARADGLPAGSVAELAAGQRGGRPAVGRGAAVDRGRHA